ncbi:MAG: glycosyltransferase, partial [Bacteroidota bacterium]
GMRTSAELREIVRRKEIDLVHANSLVAALIATSRRLGVPVVWHARDLRAPATPVKQVLAKVSAVIAISRAVEQWVRDLAPTGHVHLIYNALGPDDRHVTHSRAKVREGWEMAPHTPLLGNVGQLVPWKRQDMFLKTGAQVLQQVPEARMVIIGSDLFNEHRDYVQGLHDLASELGIADHVLWIDHADDMPSALSALDVLAHTADREPLGRVIMEAMAVGLPTVAFDEAGPAELIADGEMGLLVPPDDISALAAAAVRLLSDPALAVHLHDNALTHSARFDPALHAAAVLEVYREALAKR